MRAYEIGGIKMCEQDFAEFVCRHHVDLPDNLDAPIVFAGIRLLTDNRVPHNQAWLYDKDGTFKEAAFIRDFSITPRRDLGVAT